MAKHARRVRVREEENNALMHYGKITFIVSESIYIYTVYISPAFIQINIVWCVRKSVRKRVGGESVCAHTEREAERKEERECHFGVKLSLLRLVHSLINTDNEMFSAA